MLGMAIKDAQCVAMSKYSFVEVEVHVYKMCYSAFQAMVLTLQAEHMHTYMYVHVHVHVHVQCNENVSSHT